MPISLAQRAAVGHISDVFREFASHGRGVTHTDEAFEVLLGGNPGYDPGVSTSVAAYNRALVSIPVVGAAPVALTSVLPPDAADFLVGVGRDRLGL